MNAVISGYWDRQTVVWLHNIIPWGDTDIAMTSFHCYDGRLACSCVRETRQRTYNGIFTMFINCWWKNDGYECEWMERKRKAKEKIDWLCNEWYVRERSGWCHDKESRRVEEDDVMRRPQIRWDKGRKMMINYFCYIELVALITHSTYLDDFVHNKEYSIYHGHTEVIAGGWLHTKKKTHIIFPLGIQKLIILTYFISL